MLKGVFVCDVVGIVDNGVLSLLLDGDLDLNLVDVYFFILKRRFYFFCFYWGMCIIILMYVEVLINN